MTTFVYKLLMLLSHLVSSTMLWFVIEKPSTKIGHKLHSY
jgi:hypothetical protein